MKKRTVAASVLAGAVVLAVASFGIWLAMLPPGVAVSPEPVPASEEAVVLDALRPAAAGERPVIAVIGINDATETTDYLVPTGILRRADVADVVMVATGPGPVQLYPALKVQPDATVSEFDAAHPDGADYVIVPAMSRDDDAAVIAWLRQQSAKGAIVIGVCAGAKVVGAAGLLDGKRATTHWYYLNDLLQRSPTADYVADRRFVVDGNVATTTGITASMPMMLTLIEAIAGRERAQAVARDLGVKDWDARHASGNFRFTRDFAAGVMGNAIASWNREDLGIPLYEGIDELSLSLVADAWSRTYRSKATSFAPAAEIVTANGILVLADEITPEWPDQTLVSVTPGEPVTGALDRTLASIAGRYGDNTAEIVAMQLEYSMPPQAR